VPSLAELGLTNDVIESTALDQIPEQSGTFAPPPEPGDYRFQLPEAKALKDTFDVFDADGKQRLAVVFDQNAPLTILQSPKSAHDGEPFQTRINNVPRARNKDKTLVFSDLDLLAKALGETAASFPNAQKTNKGYGDMLMRHAGEPFNATIEWSYYCNPKRAARF
jgi:hypothetical protein